MWNRAYYMLGALRIEELFEAGGHGRVWAALAADPPPSRVLFRDALDPDPQPAEQLDGVLDGVEQYFGRGRWPVGRGTLGEMVLRSESSHVQKELDDVLASFRGGVFCEASAPTPLLMASVYAMVFADAASAARFVALAEQSAVVDGEAVTRVGRYEVTDAPATPGATGRVYVQSPSIKGVGKVVRGKIAWLRKSRFVVQVTGIGMVVPDEHVVEIAETVFGRLAGR
jgi:hypothetical protein